MKKRSPYPSAVLFICLSFVCLQHLDGSPNLKVTSAPLLAPNGLPVIERRSNNLPGSLPSSLLSAIKSISDKGPESYPKIVRVLPEPNQLDEIPNHQLLEMAQSWNPVFIRVLRNRLAEISEDILPELKKMMASENSSRRKAAVMILHGIIEHQAKNPLGAFPKEKHWKPALAKVKEKYQALIPLLLPLLKDEHSNTLTAAIKISGLLEYRNREISEAILRLFGHPDEYLAQTAAVTIARKIGVEGVDQVILYKALEDAMKNPLPGGRGWLVKELLPKQDEAFQRRCIPLILHHLKWNAKRDTMFDSTGIVEGMNILSSLKDPSIIDITPFMMKKRHKGNVFYLKDAVKAASSLGSKAKELLPLFRTSLKAAEEDLNKISQRKHLRPIDKIRIDNLNKRITVLKEGIANVEK